MLGGVEHEKCFMTLGPDKHCLSHCMYLYQVNITLYFLNDVNDIESLNQHENR